MASPEEHSEMLRLLRENVELSKENNKILHSLYRHSIIAFALRVLWYVLIIGFPFALYYYILQPYFHVLGANYEVFRQGILEIPGLKGLEHLLPTGK